ncbi:MAG TPA: energy transducer TonB [Methylomusa anaerophila]|uniref:Transport protein TonB n=1 Tax=Methylomusa anaerophila TaxID=1930071 RepID=A0A348ALM8_9FIRM|nr:energy transducer TonB [Methylomusa anaerophila]BBB91976.1 transport protein TonB [Methylomusa anaerophila]HML88011.1 energy transducer TonB [Methylomusa anaerophila]
MPERKWYLPFSTAVLINLIILGLLNTTFSQLQSSKPEYVEVEVSLAELFSPPEPVDSPANAPQQASAPPEVPAPVKSEPAKPAAGPSSVQPLAAAGAATDGNMVNVPANAGNGLINIGGSSGQEAAGPDSQGGTETGAAAAGPPGPSKPSGPTRSVRVIAGGEPDYPQVARQNGWEGTVKLRVLVSEQGLVEDVQVIASSGYSQLDQAALAGVRRWQFSPALKEGMPVAEWVAVPVRFTLR